MSELGWVFGINIWGVLDLIKLMYEEGCVTGKEIKSLMDYLDYMRDRPYPSFKKDVRKVFEDYV